MSYTRWWIVWLVLVIGGFFAIEVPALVSGELEATLSAHLRLWLGIYPGMPWGVIGGLLFVSFLVWLGIHIVIQRDEKKAERKTDE